MEISDQLVYESLQRLAMLSYQKILYADLTADTYTVLKTETKDWNLTINDATEKKLSEWFRWFSTSELCHDDDRAKFYGLSDSKALRELFDGNLNPIRLIYKRKSRATDPEFHEAILEIIPKRDQNTHIVAIMFIHEIYGDKVTNESSVQRLSEKSKLITHKQVSGKRKILVIEDNDINREILTDFLQDEYEVYEAENGLIGLEMFMSHYRELSAVLLDVMMPVFDGFNFLEKIAYDPLLRTVPIVVTTGSDDNETERRCLELGAVDFISKPYNAAILKMRMNRIIKLRESTATLSRVEMDEITGLYARDSFYHYSEDMIRKNPEQEYDLIVSSIENFRSIREAYGDRICIRILEYFGKRIQASQYPDQLNSRIRDDVFACIAPHVTDVSADSLQKVSESVLKDSPINSLSIKYAVYKKIDKNVPVAILVDRLLMAMETIRGDFTKNYVFYDDAMIKKQEREYEMESFFDEALENEEFEVWFQPKYDVINKEIVGAEALVRWRSFDGSLVPPDEFIPLFEKDGLISVLDSYIFKKVCAFQKKCQDEGKKLIPISVNISRASMFRYENVDNYGPVCQKYGVAPSLVPIEITESAAIKSTSVGKFAESLINQGFTLQMDDFGSGYSSLASTQILHFDTIKLDKTLVDFIGTPSGDSMLHHTIEFIKESNMKVTAEGVESEAQFKFLKNLKCDAIQGYYFSKPLMQADFEKLL